MDTYLEQIKRSVRPRLPVAAQRRCREQAERESRLKRHSEGSYSLRMRTQHTTNILQSKESPSVAWQPWKHRAAAETAATPKSVSTVLR